MKALSLWQPWASAIALGVKKIETRKWATDYRGPLLIHAARTRVARDDVRARALMWTQVLQPEPPRTVATAFEMLPFGAIVAVAELVDCVAAGDVETLRATCARVGEKYSPLEPELGAYERGHWAWFLRNIRRLEPVPMSAYQGLFDVDEKAIPQLRRQLAEAG